jgi:hypothetical protein
LSHNKIIELIKEHGVKLSEENVCIAFADGFVSVSLEDGKLSINVEFTDRVIFKESTSLEDFLRLNNG